MDEKMKEKIRKCMEQIDQNKERGFLKNSTEALCYASGWFRTDYPELAELLWKIVCFDRL